MNDQQRAAMQMALEALERLVDWMDIRDMVVAGAEREAITALRQAIAQAEQQEPDYFGLTHEHTWLSIDKKQYDKLKPEGRMACYTAPPQREWVEPSDEQIYALVEKEDAQHTMRDATELELARAVLKLAEELNA